MQKTFFTSDQHFDHPNSIKHNKRPWGSVEEMNQCLYDHWNSTVGKKDITYILGDFAWKNHTKHLSRLNGKKILIKGNHDKMSIKAYNCFSRVYDGIADIKMMKNDVKYRITLCHYPMMSWNASYHGAWHLFGHVHNNPFKHPCPLALNVGVDVNQYKPVSWDIVYTVLKSRYNDWVTWKENNIKENRR